MQNEKHILLEQRKRLKQELSMDPPKHRKIEIEALLYLIKNRLRFVGIK